MRDYVYTMNRRRARRHATTIRKSWVDTLMKVIGYGTCILLAYAVFTVAIVEFMVGCGERTYYPNGTWETNECVFIPYEPVKGEW